MRVARFSAEGRNIPFGTPEEGTPLIEHIIGLVSTAGIAGVIVEADPLTMTDITPEHWPASNARYWLSRPEPNRPARIDVMPAGDESTTVTNFVPEGDGQFVPTQTPLRTIEVPGPEGPFVLTGPGSGPEYENVTCLHEFIIEAR
ncbi:MAG TPA: hypothetical protein VMB52_03415 [Verrucomicrobiae bacterium]|nr:hypothetical protein [Verrucomicrobiae bacterium]